MISNDMIGLIGNTPLVRLKFKNNKWELLLKLEKFNPGQSMKDRMALNMVYDAEKKKKLKKGGTIIESSSGNTAISLAIIAAVKKYSFIAVVDHHAAVEKINIIKAYGGKVIQIDSSKYAPNEVATAERERIAAELAKKTPNSIFMHQADNEANREAYEKTLAKELAKEIPDIKVLFASIGTTGSICGTARGLKKRGINCKIIAVEPKGSIFFSTEGGPYFQSGTGNPPDAELPKILDLSVINEGLQVTDAEAFNTCRAMAKKFGILVGGSAGGVIFKAIENLAHRKDGGKAVVLVCDGGEKYTSTIYNDDWMKSNKLIDKKIEKIVEELIIYD